MKSEKLLLTPAEVAELLSVSRTTVYELLNRGLLPSIKLGSCRRIPIDGVRQLIDQLAARHE
ncbi:MAG: helix-turn-helix domain-containing protein [Actinomycetota bacterium]|nr:helix-turn-helix domain-containing protein [Actinomycetota bacterium]